MASIFEIEHQLEAGVGWRGALLALLLAYILGYAIAMIYTWTFRGLSYSRSLVQTLAVGPVVSAMLMLAIGGSLARGVGIVGTLALIRFRTNLRDPFDMVFVFCSFASGIAAGTGNMSAGVIGVSVFLLIVATLRFSGFGAIRQSDGVVRLRIPSGERADKELREALGAVCRRFALITVREVSQGQEIEFVYQVTLREPGTESLLLQKMGAIAGAAGIALSMQETTVEL
jgi:Domain of unknown function (DUF4956)